jgi:cysteine desulfurase/selenocysteine lyase
MTTASDDLTRPAANGPLHASLINDYDLPSIRADFPILEREVHGRPLVYLDNAASAQKPRQVIEALVSLYENDYANVHRGIHALGAAATDRYEGARETVRRFLNAGSVKEIVFTKGATEALNLVASSLAAGDMLQAGDEVVITELEHHSNIVPWQLLRDRMGIVLKVAPVDDQGRVELDALERLVTDRTKLVSVTHISNALGIIVPVHDVVAIARKVGALVMIDGCQSIMHLPVDVQELGADFYVFSGHKVYGPSGIGVLWAREDLLEAMPPYQGGGEMIRSVSFERSTWADLPYKFEAGTPPIAQAVGLGAALDYVGAIGLDRIAAHERDVLAYATERLSAIPGLTVWGTGDGPNHKASVVSFTMEEAHPHDIGTIVDRFGVAVRAGNHCAQPLLERFDLPATARASFGLYNSRAEVDVLVEALEKVRDMFG